ncbi:hypothetical protein J1605_008633 [Eschrichtius robustus]|uniref:Exportin-T n=1 Tax=Eschrichtius robustus TaxID=9764 RepID=A0AB34GY71_ESCRO|nr:hypothetical protein J1605_008633 [Eschrichtius robustus]
MDEQALLGLNPNADSDFRQRALAYFEQLKISPDAWQVCAEALAQRTYRYSELTTVQQQLIRETLISWLQAQEARRNTLIKDTMREQCIPNLVESWYQILQNYQYTNSEVTCQCLEVVGAYVSWIDLSLIANDRFINMLLGHMSIEVLREEACDCLFEIVNKGMDPVDKMKLVESLCQVLQSAGFFSIDQEEDVDFLARFSKLVNGMGQSLIVSWTKLIKNGDIKNAQEALQAIETKVALMLQLLIHEDDDISSNIIGFCYDYLHILKQAIMLAVMKKLTYDEEYNFENEENGYQSLLSSDDQLFIYETAGVLIVNSEYPAERKQALMRNLLTPLMEKFKILLEKLMLAQDEERQASLADCLNHAVGFARSGVRTFLHRMIICLEEEVLPFIPSASEHMLKDCEAKDLQEFIPLINQITAKFKIQVSPFLQQMFMPLLHAIFEVLLRPAEENDQSAALEKQMLRRSYFAFLQTVTGSGMSEVIANQGAENVERVLVTVIQGAVEYPDPIAQKTCFIILSKLVELWGKMI